MRGGQANRNHLNEAVNGVASEDPKKQVGHLTEDSLLQRQVELFADGSGFYSEALGLRRDLSAQGFGVRCERFALLIDEGEVREVQVDPGPISLTSAESVCSAWPLLR